MKAQRNIGLFTLIVLAFSLISSCERLEPGKQNGDGTQMSSIASDRLLILDTLNWSYQTESGGYYYFEKNANVSAPEKGDYISFSNSEFSIYGRVNDKISLNHWLGFQITTVPINEIFEFFAFRDTLRTSGTAFTTILNPVVSMKGDTVIIRDADLSIDEGNQVKGTVHIDSLEIYEQASGEVFYYLTPEWDNGTVTREIKMRWDQVLSIRGRLSFYAIFGSDLVDSMLLRTRTYSDEVVGFPVEIIVEDWLIFDWHMPGTNTITCRFDLSGAANFNAEFEQGGNWLVDNENNFTTKDLELEGWDQLESGFINLGLRTIVKTVFSGISDTYIEKNLEISIDAVAEWPNWQLSGGLTHSSSFNSGKEIFNDIPEGIFNGVPFLVNLFDKSGVLENEAPVASLNILPKTGYTDDLFKLNATLSTDKEDGINGLSARWDFNGDGIWDTNFGSSKLLAREYPVAGTYRVRVEVMDSQGATSIAWQEIVVYNTESAPKASFTINPEEGVVTDVFIFDASECTDYEDPLSVLEVRWDFENDGVWDTHFSTSKADYWVYKDPGVYDVLLQVRDSDLLTGTTTVRLRVTEGNQKPDAKFDVSPESGTTETTFNFDASESTDRESDDDDLLFQWDWQNDGVWDTEQRSLKKITHKFSTAGTYSVVLGVTDTDGLISIITKPVVVTDPNTKPTADFEFSPRTGTIDTKFTFDASGSFDTEDDLDKLEVRWDWNNYDENTYDTEFSSSKKIVKQYTEPGNYIVTVEVRDSGGLTDTKTDIIVVIQ